MWRVSRKENKCVLIHAPASGLVQAVIIPAQQFGAKSFCTDIKKQFLVGGYSLAEDHFFNNSRDFSFS